MRLLDTETQVRIKPFSVPTRRQTFGDGLGTKQPKYLGPLKSFISTKNPVVQNIRQMVHKNMFESM
jgi:hypothetical protein